MFGNSFGSCVWVCLNEFYANYSIKTLEIAFLCVSGNWEKGVSFALKLKLLFCYSCYSCYSLL